MPTTHLANRPVRPMGIQSLAKPATLRLRRTTHTLLRRSLTSLSRAERICRNRRPEHLCLRRAQAVGTSQVGHIVVHSVRNACAQQKPRLSAGVLFCASASIHEPAKLVTATVADVRDRPQWVREYALAVAADCHRHHPQLRQSGFQIARHEAAIQTLGPAFLGRRTAT